jgi:hypothetical protein
MFDDRPDWLAGFTVEDIKERLLCRLGERLHGLAIIFRGNLS